MQVLEDENVKTFLCPGCWQFCLISFLFLHLLAPMSILIPFYTVCQLKVTFPQPSPTGHFPFYRSYWVLPLCGVKYSSILWGMTLSRSSFCLASSSSLSSCSNPQPSHRPGWFSPCPGSRCHSFIHWNAEMLSHFIVSPVCTWTRITLKGHNYHVRISDAESLRVFC